MSYGFITNRHFCQNWKFKNKKRPALAGGLRWLDVDSEKRWWWWWQRYQKWHHIVKVMKRRMRRTEEEKRDEGTKREFNPMCVCMKVLHLYLSFCLFFRLYICMCVYVWMSYMTRQDCVVNGGLVVVTTMKTNEYFVKILFQVRPVLLWWRHPVSKWNWGFWCKPRLQYIIWNIDHIICFNSLQKVLHIQ